MDIPDKVSIGGQMLEVIQPNEIEGGKLGQCCVAAGYIKIADTFNGKKQSGSSKENTFWHEVTHAILDTMGRGDLNEDESFVCCFSGFLTECINSIEKKK